MEQFNFEYIPFKKENWNRRGDKHHQLNWRQPLFKGGESSARVSIWKNGPSLSYIDGAIFNKALDGIFGIRK